MSSSDTSFDSRSDSEAAETEVEYDLEVEVSSKASEQGDTSDDDEPEDVDANEPLTDKKWLAKYEAGRQTEQELEETLQRWSRRSQRMVSLFWVACDAPFSSAQLSGVHL